MNNKVKLKNKVADLRSKEIPFLPDGINPNENFMKDEIIYNNEKKGIVKGFRIGGVESKQNKGKYYFVVKLLNYSLSKNTNWWVTVSKDDLFRNPNISFDDIKLNKVFQSIDFRMKNLGN